MRPGWRTDDRPAGPVCAAKSERRPATAADLAAELKKLLGESPATVDPPAARRPPAPQPPESRTPAAPPDVDSPHRQAHRRPWQTTQSWTF